MYTSRIKQGIAGGLAGGLVFGMMMLAMGMLPMIGGMVGLPYAWAGFLMHLMISAAIGAGFGLVLGPFVKGPRSGLLLGMGYGSAWWILGPLTMMPLMMGMGLGANWTLAAARTMLPSLMGHAIFGLVLGFAYARGEQCLIGKIFGKSGTDSPSQNNQPAPRAV